MPQLPLLSRFNPPPFRGESFVAEHDEQRLTSQLERVRRLMLDGRWRTLPEIAAQAKGSEPSVSARLRQLRHPEWGGYVVERRRRGNPRSGVHEYRFSPATEDVR